jgi:hypothetical protein
MADILDRNEETARKVWGICQSVARSMWVRRQPTEAYADRVARLLFGTAAHESASFIYRRQIGFEPHSERGAFGLWQVENGSATDSMYAIVKSPFLRSAVRECVSERSYGIVLSWCAKTALRATQRAEHDDLSCVLARLHYMRVQSSVPATPDEQAAYWKAHYNTVHGKGTPEQWLRSYRKWEHVIHG